MKRKEVKGGREGRGELTARHIGLSHGRRRRRSGVLYIPPASAGDAYHPGGVSEPLPSAHLASPHCCCWEPPVFSLPQERRRRLAAAEWKQALKHGSIKATSGVPTPTISPSVRSLHLLTPPVNFCYFSSHSLLLSARVFAALQLNAAGSYRGVGDAGLRLAARRLERMLFRVVFV